MKKFFKKGEWKLLWPFYSVNFLSMFVFYTLFAILYFTEMGLTPVQIGLLYTVSSIASIIFEIPTGAIADIFGRKFSTLLGYILSGIIPIAIYFTNSFSILLILYVIWGISYTFISGANHAWIVDLIKSKRKNDLIDSYFAKEHSFYAIGGVLSGLVGAFLVSKFGLGVIWLSFGGAYIVGTIILSFGKEKFTRKKQHIKEHVKEFLSHNKKAVKCARKDKNISKILFATLFFAISLYVCMADIIWVPLFSSLGLSQASFGYIISFTWIAGTFAPFLSKHIASKFKTKKSYLMIVLALMFISIILTIFFNTLFVLMALYLIYISMFDFWAPVHRPFFQKQLPNKMRATILSLREFMFSLAAALIPLLVGALLEFVNPKHLLLGGALFLIPVIIIYSKLKEK